jgi:hypothetical protein
MNFKEDVGEAVPELTVLNLGYAAIVGLPTIMGPQYFW